MEVPNLLPQSVMVHSVSVCVIMACCRETDRSLILISLVAPLPKVIVFENIAYHDSSVWKLRNYDGISSSRSKCIAYLTLLARSHRHISQVKLARFIITMFSVLQIVPTFYNSHRRRQCRWTCPTLPVQLHGEIIGLGRSA